MGQFSAKPTVIFDLDGTLADTSGDLVAAANACFAEQGEASVLDAKSDAALAFAGGRAMLRAGFDRIGAAWDEADVDRAFPTLLHHYSENIAVYSHLYDGAGQAVRRLEADGYPIGICTNKPEGLARSLVKELKIDQQFQTIVGADTLSVRKPDPQHLWETIDRCDGDKTRAVLIGDTVNDRETAQAAGVPCVLVSFGPDGRAVEDFAPEALLDHYDDLFDVLARLDL